VKAKIEESLKSLKAGLSVDDQMKALGDGMHYCSKEAVDSARSLPGVDQLSGLQLIFTVAKAAEFFVLADIVHPACGGVNKNTTQKAFDSCILNITAEKMTQLWQRLKGRQGSETHTSAFLFLFLVRASALFVTKPGEFNGKAFDAAFGNLTEDRVDKVKAFFPDWSEAYFCLLRASGRFVGKDGSFARERFNEALAGVTAERVAEIKRITKLPLDMSAVDVILMNASLAAQAE